MMYSNVVEIEDFEKWEAILEAPFQLLLQLFIISRGRTAGKYKKNEPRQMTYYAVVISLNHICIKHEFSIFREYPNHLDHFQHNYNYKSAVYF